MANHKNTKKAVRNSETKRVRNRYYLKSTRTLIKNILAIKKKKEAEVLLPNVQKEIDKAVKRNIFKPNKGANLKSGITKHINSLK